MVDINGKADADNLVESKKKNVVCDGCCCYDKNNGKCTRIRKDGTKGICWIERFKENIN